MVALTQAMAAGRDRGAGAGATSIRSTRCRPSRASPRRWPRSPSWSVTREPAQRDHRARAPRAADAARLESWGDYAAEEGVLGLMQPTMGPVQIDGKPVDGKTTGDVLLGVGRQALGSRTARARSVGHLPGLHPGRVAEDRQGVRQHRLVRGFLGRSPAARRRVAHRRGPRGLAPPGGRTVQGGAPKLEGGGSHALMIYPSSRFYDGRGGDLPWLQEAPDGITQVAWDSWLEIPAETAKQMGIARGDLVKVTSPHGAIELPAYPTELVHPGAVAVAMGQGHKYAGAFAQRGNAATGTQSQTDFLNVGANPIELLPAAPDPASGGLPLLVGEGLARQDRRAAPARHPAGPARPGRSRDRAARAARRRARARAARQAARARRSSAHVPAGEVSGVPLGHDGGRGPLHRLPGLRGRLPEREQRADGREGAGGLRPHPALAADRALAGGHVRPSRSTCSCPCSASTARSRRASRCARSTRRTTRARASTARSTTAAWARATAATTAPTTCGSSTGSTTSGRRRSTCSSTRTSRCGSSA